MPPFYVWVPCRAKCLVVGGGRGAVSGCGTHMLVSGKEFLYAVIFCMKSAFQKVFLLLVTRQGVYMYAAYASEPQGITLPPVA